MAAQEAALSPGPGQASPPVPAPSGPTPAAAPRQRSVQRMAAPVQMVQHASPTADATVSALMTTAGITNFGPYVWDDAVPMFKLAPGYAAWTLADCVSTAVYQPETLAVAGEKGAKHSLIQNRRKAALKAVFGVTQGVVDAIMAVSAGAAPRALATLGTEDGYSGGHIVQRHILGSGLMTGNQQVAERAAFWNVGGTAMDLDPSGVASVFGSMSDAQAAVQTWITNELVANWATHRVSLAKNTQVKGLIAAAAPVVQYVSDTPGTKYPLTDKPKYMGGTGDRELYAGHYTGGATDPNAPDTSKAPLTTGGSATWGNVYVIVDPKASAPGGWAVYTAYPKP